MQRLFRTFLILPALIIGLVVIPTVAFSASREGDFQISLNQSTISPLPTPTNSGTVPPPTPTSKPPVVVYPTATPVYRPPVVAPKPVVPTATPTLSPATPTDEAYIGNERIIKVIGDRLSSTIYAYTDAGWLYRSDDDGRVWTLVTTDPMVDDFVMNAINPDVLYSDSEVTCEGGTASADEPMYRSIDGGLTWIELPGSLTLRPMLSHQGDPNSLFAADCTMLYLTTDGGLTWEAKPDSSPDALWSNFRVVDMAASSLLGDPQPEEPNWNQLFAAGLNENGTGVVAFSNDLGDTWVRLTPNIDPAPWGMTAITADPFVEGLLGFSEPRSVWFTENFGVNWQVTTKGLSNVVDRGIEGAPFGLNDITYHPAGELYLATARGLYHKATGDNAWSKVEDTDFDLAELIGLLFTETNQGKLWINSTDGVFVYVIE
jgi:hypothetical protein